MTPSLAAVHDACVQRAAQFAAEVARIRASFERASGAFTPDDPFYEERAAALWDRVLTDPDVVARLAETEPPWIVQGLGRAQRGLYEARVEGEDLDLSCVLSGAMFRLSRADSAHVSLRTGRELVPGERLDAFVVPTPEGVSLLPSVLAHPASARTAMDAVIGASIGPPTAGHAIDRAERYALLDLLLGMRHRLKTQGRMRPEVVYRVSARGP